MQEDQLTSADPNTAVFGLAQQAISFQKIACKYWGLG